MVLNNENIKSEFSTLYLDGIDIFVSFKFKILESNDVVIDVRRFLFSEKLNLKLK